MSKLYKLAPALLLLLFVFVAGCDSGGDDDESDPTVTGSWVGTTTVQGAVLTMDIQLTERDQTINGSGSLTLVDPIAVRITGTHNFPNVALTITSSGLQDLNFTGTLAGGGESLTGRLVGSGFDNFSITLRKQ